MVRPATSDVRALTLHQPWAVPLLSNRDDRKDVENRSRSVPSTLPTWGLCEGCGERISPDDRAHAHDGEPLDFHVVINPNDPGYRIVPDHHPGCLGDCHKWGCPVQRQVQTDPRMQCGPIREEDGPFPFRLGIHTAKVWGDARGYAMMQERAFAPGPLDEYQTWQDGLPRGMLVGFVTVAGCHHADVCRRVDHPRGWGTHVRWCSRWAQPDQYHITTTDPVRLDEPIPMRGYQVWWRLPDGIDVPAVAA